MGRWQLQSVGGLQIDLGPARLMGLALTLKFIILNPTWQLLMDILVVIFAFWILKDNLELYFNGSNLGSPRGGR